MRFVRFHSLFFISVAFIALSGAVRGAPGDPEQEKARKKLEDKDVKFTVKDFFWNVQTEEYGIVSLFLKAGMDVNSGNERGETALHVAADSDGVKMVQTLLQAKADVHAKSKSGHTPLYTAVKKSSYGSTKILQALLTAGAASDVNLRDEWGKTVLHEAAGDDNAEAVSLLIKAGADVNARDKTRRLFTSPPSRWE